LVILEKKIVGLSPQSLGRFVQRARKAAGLEGSVDVLVTSSSALRRMNLRFRQKDASTDVLSFPSREPVRKKQGSRVLAGEIAISADLAAASALQLGHSAAKEVKILALHGILHLAGLDHERDHGEMARKERALRKLLRLPTALIERSHPGDTNSAPAVHGMENPRRAPRTA
jgi:probable rRNA maturation factor